MTCQNCARHVTEAIKGLNFVASVQVELEAARAIVRVTNSEDQHSDQIIQAIESAGFTAANASSASESGIVSWLRDWKTSVIVAASALLYFMAAEWLLGWHHRDWFPGTAFLVALVVQTYCGSRFYLGAWRQLRTGRSNMDTLVSLGSTAAFGYSTYIFFSGAPLPLYFMESVGIIAFVSVGHYIENQVAKNASGALESLLALTPNQATRVLNNGDRQLVDISTLTRGDQIAIAPGEQVPVDGIVSSGESACDESMLTGESIPIDKEGAMPVYAGTLNLSGQLIVSVTGTGSETALARVITVVERAQNSKANIQRLADQISNVFVPMVVAMATVTMAIWFFAPGFATSIHHSLVPYLWSTALPPTALAAAVIHCAAVLIIACPCAMGLATPIAIMAGTNVAAKHGILIRDGHALERSGIVTKILFDKTGTLTLGKPELASIEWMSAEREMQSDITDCLQSLAVKSKHPLSQALARDLAQASEPKAFSSWSELPGKGIIAVENNRSGRSPQLRLGSLTWLRSEGVDISPVTEFQRTHTSSGATVIAFARDQQLLAVASLRDQLKEGAKSMIHTLRTMGLEISMVSGDHQITAEAIAQELGIPHDQTYAETSPEKKAALIESLQASGSAVCFVGDGINDAPALEQASLGIAVCAASDIAKESADIILLQSDIQAIPRAIKLARASLRTIKQNLFWAFFYNAIGIPLAALGFLSPLLCAAAMGLSDLVVVGNALRLRFRRF